MSDDEKPDRGDRFVDSGWVFVKPATGESAAKSPTPDQHHYARHGLLRAPRGQFKVILADTFDHTDVSFGVFADREDALRVAREHSGSMKVCLVYDDRARVVGEFGTA